MPAVTKMNIGIVCASIGLNPIATVVAALGLENASSTLAGHRESRSNTAPMRAKKMLSDYRKMPCSCYTAFPFLSLPFLNS